MNKENVWKELALWAAAAVLCVVLVYAGYWITKRVSYRFFYADMVKQTIKEMVVTEALR